MSWRRCVYGFVFRLCDWCPIAFWSIWKATVYFAHSLITACYVSCHNQLTRKHSAGSNPLNYYPTHIPKDIPFHNDKSQASSSSSLWGDENPLNSHCYCTVHLGVNAQKSTIRQLEDHSWKDAIHMSTNTRTSDLSVLYASLTILNPLFQVAFVILIENNATSFWILIQYETNNR